MRVLGTNVAASPLVFIPNLLKPPGTAARTGIRPACSTRHPLGHPALIPSPPTSRLPSAAVLSRSATSNYHAAPSIISIPASSTFHTLPLITVPTSEPDPSFKPTTTGDNTPNASVTPVSQRRGHRHTEESRRKIGIANRGNTPWNKGRRHSEETKRKIAENTKRAMLRPEMRQMLQQRAKGRKHTEATKLKIRETARLTRGTAKSAKRKQKKCPVPYTFTPDVVKHLNDCIAKQIEETFVKDDGQDSPMYVVREKRVVSEDTRQKLSRRIKEMWNDPDYRSRVASGVEERYKRLSDQKKVEPSGLVTEEVPTTTRPSSPIKRRPRLKKKKEANETQAKRSRIPRTDQDLDDDADIVLGPDSLKGWTKEDLGIVGTHGAGRIDQEITGTLSRSEMSLSRNQGECCSPASQESPSQLLRAETVDTKEVSYEEHMPLSQESLDSKFSSPFPVVQELDFSRLDIANEYTLSRSYGDHVDFFEEPVTSFAQEREVDLGISVGPLDQSDDFFAGSMTERVEHDSDMGNNGATMTHRPQESYMDEERQTFESF